MASSMRAVCCPCGPEPMPEIDSRAGGIVQLLKEYLRHGVVVVLAGMDDPIVDLQPRALASRATTGASFTNCGRAPTILAVRIGAPRPRALGRFLDCADAVAQHVRPRRSPRSARARRRAAAAPAVAEAAHPADLPRGHADHQREVGHVAVDHRAGADEGVLADGDAADDACSWRRASRRVAPACRGTRPCALTAARGL